MKALFSQLFFLVCALVACENSLSLAGSIDVGAIEGTESFWAEDLLLREHAACNLNLPVPNSVWRGAFFGRSRTIACSKSVEEIEKFAQANGGQSPLQMLADETAKHIVKEYKENCLIKFSAVEDSNQFLAMSSPEELQRIRRSIGSLSVSGNDHFCSGSLVEMSDQSVGLLTAIHCLGKTVEVNDTTSQLNEPEKSRLVFKSISNELISFELGEGFAHRNYRQLSEDVVVLRLPLDQPKQYLPLANFVPSIWDDIYIIGANPYLLRDLSGNRISKISDIIAVSFEPYCVLMARDSDGKMHHMCQTDKRQSGSPILSIKGGRFYVSGLHFGTQPAAQNATCSDRAIPTTNIGLSIIQK